MTSREFCYWLQGYFEINGDDEKLKQTEHMHIYKISGLDAEQVKIIKNHLAMVFKHEIDPSYKPQTVQQHQSTLTDLHSGTNKPGSNSLLRC